MSVDRSSLFPLWDLAACSAAPLGMPMCQNRLAIPTWSYAMERNPPARIIEIGTYSGGLITALAVHAHMIGAKVITYDLCLPDERVTPLAHFLGVSFRHGSCWDLAGEIAALISRPGVTYVLCDGGDKPRELATFAPYLKLGDVIAAHDYEPPDGPHGADVYWPCGEITAAQGAAVATANALEPWLQKHFDLAAWLVYQKQAP